MAKSNLERTTLNLPAGTKERVRRAIAAAVLMGEAAPEDFTAFVVAALEEKMQRVMARFAESGGALPQGAEGARGRKA